MWPRAMNARQPIATSGQKSPGGRSLRRLLKASGEPIAGSSCALAAAIRAIGMGCSMPVGAAARQ